ncbi:hypothetical protein J437_LFUL008571 [Ladona fulva]|uniref:Integrase catalytic domain-containing protein n=1 Tax=Ladona fulva TaxID=123851 RepID=A0A8K0P030_LADFU|nr:hypothetical protein J437_LFUL008571 [Ladona fulva]
MKDMSGWSIAQARQMSFQMHSHALTRPATGHGKAASLASNPGNASSRADRIKEAQATDPSLEDLRKKLTHPKRQGETGKRRLRDCYKMDDGVIYFLRTTHQPWKLFVPTRFRPEDLGAPQRKGPLRPHKPTNPWETIAVDLMGPYPRSPRGKTNLLVVTDMFPRWTEAFLLGYRNPRDCENPGK